MTRAGSQPTAMNTQSIAVLAIGRRGWVESYPTLPPALEATALGCHRAWWRYTLDDLKAAFGAALESG